MARRTTQPPLPDDFEEHILDIDVGDEMRTSFLEYAYSVIYSRALPDARDGLKPVHRRILYTMNEMGLRPDRGHVKSARVVGEVMGRAAPARRRRDLRRPGPDGAVVVDAAAHDRRPRQLRLARRLPRCDALHRVRHAPPAVAMTASIDEDTVDFKPNYDGRETEPTVLPSAIPNLIVNGTTGIAVGMATNIAPHNLVEVVQALKHLITHPQVTIDDLMRFIPGPDLPSGGKIVGLDGIRDAYETGRGTFRSDRERCLAAGMNDYVAKPIRVDELVAAIKRTPRRASGSSTRVADPSRDGLIDEAVLARLADGTGGDEGFVSELIEQFVADAPRLVAAARAGLDAGDAGEVRRAAHTLKSNAATFGANALAGRSRELEDAAKRGALEGASEQVDAMGSELDLVLEALPAVWRKLSAEPFSA